MHDKPTVKSAGLVSSVHLLRKAPEMVRQWVNKVKAALGVRQVSIIEIDVLIKKNCPPFQ